MDTVGKALWYIESHFAQEITLDQISEVSGISRFALCRAFGTSTGQSVMRYVRGRRLTEAARVLANGAADILSVALDSGYGSHEAFTRAFRDQFGLTPEAVRAQGNLDNISLVEAIRMDQKLTVNLEPPRFETGKTLLIAGLSEKYRYESAHNIPQLWQRFVPYLGHIPGEVGHTTYGVIYNNDDAGNFEYMAGVEVSSFDRLQEELSRVRIPEHEYAVFSHRGHISTIRNTMGAIFREWLPNSGKVVADGPEFEKYGPEFDPKVGTGLVEIWVPLKQS